MACCGEKPILAPLKSFRENMQLVEKQIKGEVNVLERQLRNHNARNTSLNQNLTISPEGDPRKRVAETFDIQEFWRRIG